VTFRISVSVKKLIKGFEVRISRLFLPAMGVPNPSARTYRMQTVDKAKSSHKIKNPLTKSRFFQLNEGKVNCFRLDQIRSDQILSSTVFFLCV